MSVPTFDEKGSIYKAKPYGLKDSDSSSIWSESTTDGLRPTRLYQVTLLLAGFMTTFQTIGMNQSYGVFQASSPINLRSASFPDIYHLTFT